MTGTEYTVASATQLWGGRIPSQRREKMKKTIDQHNRDTSALGRRGHVRTIRFRETAATPASDGKDASVASGEKGGQARASSSNDPAAVPASALLPSTVYRAPKQTSSENNTTASGTRPTLRDARKSPVVVEFPARVQELQAASTLPAKHTARIAQTARVEVQSPLATIDASGTKPPLPAINSTGTDTSSDDSGLSRSTSRRRKRSSQVAAIYFSPINVTQSQICLSDPLESPSDTDAVLTPTQARDNEPVNAAEQGLRDDRSMLSSPLSSPRHQRPEQEAPTKVTLTPAQIDRLVKALADSPLLTSHVKRQWWDDVPDDASVVSDTLPSLSSGSGSGSATFYSQENQRFLNEPGSPTTTQMILEEGFKPDYPDHPKAKHPVQHAAAAVRTTRFGGIALVDPKITGVPIRFVSDGYRLGANVLQVGACSFLNIPYGTTVQSNLRIEPPSSVSGNVRVMLQVANQVLERKTGKKTYLLVAELDVTETFTKAALMELAAAADIPLAEIQFMTPSEKDREADIDWCALADEFEASCEVISIVELAATSFVRLTSETCSMQTLTLMAELERIKTQHQDFLVVRATGYHSNGMFSGVSVPWTSQHLDMTLFETNPDQSCSEAKNAARALRDRVVSAVASGCAERAPFNTRIWWGDQMRQVRCVPLLESPGDDQPAIWVAFLSGEF
ncbi:hypothetical protein B0A50_00757 [Salinomyces thailandicus]|uniref:Uncharacterized protein n=1 Tax=Salinomyces thailandicus TaxID=706561 RepID=A0A4U0UCY8_9PEZI|nr:hypothetical protein B0A50_00757 [Salinomyces thailandica]